MQVNFWQKLAFAVIVSDRVRWHHLLDYKFLKGRHHGKRKTWALFANCLRKLNDHFDCSRVTAQFSKLAKNSKQGNFIKQGVVFNAAIESIVTGLLPLYSSFSKTSWMIYG